VAWSRWYRQVDRPCLDRVQNRSKKDRLGRHVQADQRRRPGESVECWHKDTLHLLEKYQRTTSVAYQPAIAVDTLLTCLNLSPGSYSADKVLLCRAATVPAESTLLTEVNRAIASLFPLFATYEHSELANLTFPPRRRTITGGSSSQSPAVRDPSRTFSTYNVRASVHRYVRLVHISDSTTKNGVNQEARFPKNMRSTPKNTGQTLQENWKRMSDARSCYDCLLPGHIEADCTTDKGQAAALRVILEWLASTHEAVLPDHDARFAVHAWYRTNGVDFGRHDTNVLSPMTAAVKKAGLAVPKAGRPAVKRAVGRKTDPVNAVSSNDDSTSE
jgi:RNase P subunit RPR2